MLVGQVLAWKIERMDAENDQDDAIDERCVAALCLVKQNFGIAVWNESNRQMRFGAFASDHAFGSVAALIMQTGASAVLVPSNLRVRGS